MPQSQLDSTNRNYILCYGQIHDKLFDNFQINFARSVPNLSHNVRWWFLCYSQCLIRSIACVQKFSCWKLAYLSSVRDIKRRKRKSPVCLIYSGAETSRVDFWHLSFFLHSMIFLYKIDFNCCWAYLQKKKN